MTNLFVTVPDNLVSASSAHDGMQSTKRICMLERLEPLIWKLITADGRSEARLWLCNAVASINTISRRRQSTLFFDILRSPNPPKDDEGRSGQMLARQLLRMLCEKAPEKAGKIISKRSQILQSFFKGHTRRILQWFDHFAGIGESEHKRGAKSISQFAFVNRDICWDELEWKGRHGQSPAMVATKPHYFMDLDVLNTVENFIENVQEFWSSEQFTKSVQDGEIISLDLEFFVDELLDMMYRDDSSEVWQAVQEFILEEKFCSLCQRLLILLSDMELLTFLNAVGKILASRNKHNGFDSSDKVEMKTSQFSWLETVMSTGMECQSLDELLLINACINQGRQILRDEEHEEERTNLERIMLEMKQSSKDSEHWALRRECIHMKKWMAIKFLAIENLVLHYHLSSECKTVASCESLFTLNGIQFDCYSNELSSIERSLKFSHGSKKSKKKRKEKAGKKKRRKLSSNHYSSASGDEDMGKEYGNILIRSELEEKWILSTDNNASIWSMGDLPEHLAGYAVMSWLKWVISCWNCELD